MATPVKVFEHTIPGTAFSRPPIVGDYIRTKSGGTLLHVQRVRRVVGAKGETYRLQAVRVRLCHLPEGIEPLPWPLPRVRRKATAGERLPGTIVTRAAHEKAQRERVKALREDPNQLVQPVRIANGSASRRDWRDPDDLSPNRRTARVVCGYAGRDQVQVLLDSETITPALAWVARRFVKEYELAVIGIGNGRNLAQAPTGFSASGGPSETRMLHMQTYESTAQALRPHLLRLLIEVIVKNTSLKDYAERHRVRASVVAGEVIAGLSYLRDYYKEVDDGPAEDRSE